MKKTSLLVFLSLLFIFSSCNNDIDSNNGINPTPVSILPNADFENENAVKNVKFEAGKLTGYVNTAALEKGLTFKIKAEGNIYKNAEKNAVSKEELEKFNFFKNKNGKYILGVTKLTVKNAGGQAQEYAVELKAEGAQIINITSSDGVNIVLESGKINAFLLAGQKLENISLKIILSEGASLYKNTADEANKFTDLSNVRLTKTDKIIIVSESGSFKSEASVEVKDLAPLPKIKSITASNNSENAVKNIKFDSSAKKLTGYVNTAALKNGLTFKIEAVGSVYKNDEKNAVPKEVLKNFSFFKNENGKYILGVTKLTVKNADGKQEEYTIELKAEGAQIINAVSSAGANITFENGTIKAVLPYGKNLQDYALKIEVSEGASPYKNTADEVNKISNLSNVRLTKTDKIIVVSESGSFKSEASVEVKDLAPLPKIISVTASDNSENAVKNIKFDSSAKKLTGYVNTAALENGLTFKIEAVGSVYKNNEKKPLYKNDLEAISFFRKENNKWNLKMNKFIVKNADGQAQEYTVELKAEGAEIINVTPYAAEVNITLENGGIEAILPYGKNLEDYTLSIQVSEGASLYKNNTDKANKITDLSNVRLSKTDKIIVVSKNRSFTNEMKFTVENAAEPLAVITAITPSETDKNLVKDIRFDPKAKTFTGIINETAIKNHELTFKVEATGKIYKNDKTTPLIKDEFEKISFFNKKTMEPTVNKLTVKNKSGIRNVYTIDLKVEGTSITGIESSESGVNCSLGDYPDKIIITVPQGTSINSITFNITLSKRAKLLKDGNLVADTAQVSLENGTKLVVQSNSSAFKSKETLIEVKEEQASTSTSLLTIELADSCKEKFKDKISISVMDDIKFIMIEHEAGIDWSKVDFIAKADSSMDCSLFCKNADIANSWLPEDTFKMDSSLQNLTIVTSTFAEADYINYQLNFMEK